MDDAELLAEIEDILRTMPERATLHHDLPENYSWFGRLNAVLSKWDVRQSLQVEMEIPKFRRQDFMSEGALDNIITTIHTARHDLLMKTTGPMAKAIDTTQVFDYFDELRGIIELAKADLLFIDPYMEADFVARYLPHVGSGVSVRLLAGKLIPKLEPAVRTFKQQHGLNVQVRSSANIHDRFVFVDQRECYLSGASFKDGAKKSPTALVPITDAFADFLAIYEDHWNNAQQII